MDRRTQQSHARNKAFVKELEDELASDFHRNLEAAFRRLDGGRIEKSGRFFKNLSAALRVLEKYDPMLPENAPHPAWPLKDLIEFLHIQDVHGQTNFRIAAIAAAMGFYVGKMQSYLLNGPDRVRSNLKSETHTNGALIANERKNQRASEIMALAKKLCPTTDISKNAKAEKIQDRILPFIKQRHREMRKKGKSVFTLKNLQKEPSVDTLTRMIEADFDPEKYFRTR